MNRQPTPFHDRLALARRIVALRDDNLPVQIADQLDAAARDTRAILDHLGLVLPVMMPDRRWQHRVDGEPSDETRAYLLAAVMGCTSVCVHLRRGGPRPAIARLPLGRIDCGPCAQTNYRSPTEDADRCDVCGERGVVMFHPFAVRQGPLLLAGDACTACAPVLGIRADAAAS